MCKALKVGRIDKKFLRSLDRTLELLCIDSTHPRSHHFQSFLSTPLAHVMWSETRTTGRRQGQGRRSSFVVPGHKGWFWSQNTRKVSGPGAASATQPLASPPPLPPLAESLPVAVPDTPWWGQLPAQLLALPPPSRVASRDCFEKQVCMPVLPRLSPLNPFITALVQESGLSEVGMNN